MNFEITNFVTYKTFLCFNFEIINVVTEPVTTETVQVSTEKLQPHVVMPSLADIQGQDNSRKKLSFYRISFKVPVLRGNEGSA
jgi:hypothetical protein